MITWLKSLFKKKTLAERCFVAKHPSGELYLAMVDDSYLSKSDHSYITTGDWVTERRSIEFATRCKTKDEALQLIEKYLEERNAIDLSRTPYVKELA